ncbi:hypothetical protein AX14_013557 [Amanita brunnescens Koide BX004]|nr:hypothetical protein AX14_013557 [Amanita brunnescens Koide BX004]
MRAVTGPLKTGTYISEVIETSGISRGEFIGLNKNRTKLTLTKNVSEAVEWSKFNQSMGNDRYRCTAKDFNLTATHNVNENVGISEGVSEWIIKETDVQGEYLVSSIAEPSLYMSVERGEQHFEGKAGAKGTIHRYYLVDE